MVNLDERPEGHFKKAKDYLKDWAENEATGGNAKLFEAGVQGFIGSYELVDEIVKGHKKKDGTWVKPYTRKVKRKITRNGNDGHERRFTVDY